MPKVQYIRRHDRPPILTPAHHRLAGEVLATVRLWAEFCQRYDPLVAGVEVAGIIAHNADTKDALADDAREIGGRLLAVAGWVNQLRCQIETTTDNEWKRREYPNINRFPRPPVPTDKV